MSDLVPLLVPLSVTASLALLTYDWLCTLDREVKYIWQRRWTTTSVMFLLNRYLPFIDTSISLTLLTTARSPEVCLQRFKVVTWLIFFGIVLSEIILMLRTYAIWERRRSILITFIVLGCLVFIPSFAITYIEVTTLRYGPTDSPGCALEHAGTIIFIAYVLLLACETTILVLTMWKAVKHLRHVRTSWIKQLYTDGLLFYIYVVAIATANVVVPVAAPPDFSNWLATPQRVIHSVICTRVLLFMRAANETKDTWEGATAVSQISFRREEWTVENIELEGFKLISHECPSGLTPSPEEMLSYSSPGFVHFSPPFSHEFT